MHFTSYMTVLIVIAAITSGCNCFSSDADAPEHKRMKRAINGQDATIEEWPWYVSLTNPDGTHGCGGSLVANEWVLTSAYCIVELFGVPMWPTSVTLGSVHANVTQLDNGEYESRMIGGQSCDVLHAYKHPRYNSATHEFDVALLRINCEQPFTIDAIDTITLPVDKDHFFMEPEDQRLYVIGMGRISNESTNDYYPLSHTLQQTEMYSTRLADCVKEDWDSMEGKEEKGRTEEMDSTVKKDSTESSSAVDASQMCRRIIRGAVNRGDSGSPVVMRGQNRDDATLYGVVSWESLDAKNDRSAFYHYVPTSVEWIRKTMNRKNVHTAKSNAKVHMPKPKDARPREYYNYKPTSWKKDVPTKQKPNGKNGIVFWGIVFVLMSCCGYCCRSCCCRSKRTVVGQNNRADVYAV